MKIQFGRNIDAGKFVGQFGQCSGVELVAIHYEGTQRGYICRLLRADGTPGTEVVGIPSLDAGESLAAGDAETYIKARA